jgi:hypothetical protein
VDSFAYYDPRHIICQRYDYTSARLLVEKTIFDETLQNKWTKKLMIKLANKYPNRYDNYLSHLFPLDALLTI